MSSYLNRISHCCTITRTRCKFVTSRTQWSRVDRFLTTQALNPDRLCGIWYVPKAAAMDVDEFVHQLPELLPSKRKNLTTAIFFATPSVANWFAPEHDFLQKSINRLYQPVLPETPPTSIVAIVDALPGPKLFERPLKDDTDQQPFRGAEGLALCLLPGSESLIPTVTTNSELPLIHFQSSASQTAQNKRCRVSASLQVANTLFVNGSKATLFRDHWTSVKGTNGLTWQSPDSSEELEGLQFSVHRGARNFLQFTERLRTITQPRQVISSMGNVVRELQQDDGSAMKASTELENLVPQFLKDYEAKLGPGRVEVYALLMPPSIAVEPEYMPKDQEDVERDLSAHVNPSIPSIATSSLLHKALWQGGRLHKVTGGGGGWGKKAGLLSLETAVNFEGSSNFEISMFPSFDEDGQSAANRVDSSAMEAIPQGWSIQFLATFIGPEKDPYQNFLNQQTDDPRNWTAQRWSWASRRNKVLLGTTDPKDERISSDPENPHLDGKVIAVPGAFGMLSPNGICFSLETWNADETERTSSSTDHSVHQFRVDAPQTIFRTGMPVKLPAKDYSELDEIPPFESSNSSQSQILGSMVDGAIRQSRKPFFRKISYQPKPKFEIPKSKQRKESKEEDQSPLRIRKYTSARSSRLWRPT